MKALTLDLRTHELRIGNRPEPGVTEPDGVKLRVLEVGICGTDREEVAGVHGRPPAGREDLVPGHEMIGVVCETGGSADGLRPGDLAVVSVRRPCGLCRPCELGRPDMCTSGLYVERGIREADGFQAEYVADRAAYVVKLPRSMAGFGVLCEPASIAEKAIGEAWRLQRARLPAAPGTELGIEGSDVLVAGLGPVGLLAAMRLALLGARVHGLDVVAEDDLRVRALQSLGGVYFRSGQGGPDDDRRFDLIVEATGVPSVEVELLQRLAPNGIFIGLGIPGRSAAGESVSAGDVFRSLVLGNQLVLGSVNASIEHMRSAARWLEEAESRWPGLPASLITERLAVSDYAQAFAGGRPNEIKTVIHWSDA